MSVPYSAIDSVRGGGGREFEPTGSERVDPTVQKGRERLAGARAEEDFQGVGLLCREALITLGQVVWVAERHPPVDGVVPSDTDAKRRLEAYIAVELGDQRQRASSLKHAKGRTRPGRRA